jgi:arginase
MNDRMKNQPFLPEDILYVGLQDLHDYQQEFLDKIGVNYKVQTKNFISDEEIKTFVESHKHILIHMDIDVLDEKLFHSTYYANTDAIGDGAGGGKMTLEKLGDILKLIEKNSNMVGFTIAEYLPFDEHKLHNMLSELKIFG